MIILLILIHGCHRSGNGQGKKKFFEVREETFRVKWVQRTAVISGWRPLPYLKFCIYLVREIELLSGKSQGILKTDVCGNHVDIVRINLMLVTLGTQEG